MITARDEAFHDYCMGPEAFHDHCKGLEAFHDYYGT